MRHGNHGIPINSGIFLNTAFRIATAHSASVGFQTCILHLYRCGTHSNILHKKNSTSNIYICIQNGRARPRGQSSLVSSVYTRTQSLTERPHRACSVPRRVSDRWQHVRPLPSADAKCCPLIQTHISPSSRISIQSSEQPNRFTAWQEKASMQSCRIL